jgi:hypothetical protein
VALREAKSRGGFLAAQFPHPAARHSASKTRVIESVIPGRAESANPESRHKTKRLPLDSGLSALRPRPARLPSSPAKAGDPVTPVIPHRDRRDYWMPACAGMTVNNDTRNNSQTLLTLIHDMDYMPVIPPHRPWGHLQRLLMLGRGAVAGPDVGDAASLKVRRSKPLLSRRASRAPRGSFDGISVPGIGQGYRAPTGQDPRNGR